MSTALKIVAALVLLFAAALVRASALGAFGGAWSIELVRGPEHARLIFEFDARRGHSHHASEREIDAATLGLRGPLSAAGETSVRFTFAREAGSFACRGTAARGFGGGSFTFAPSEAFLEHMRERGYGELQNPDVVTAAALDLTTGFIDALASEGYTHLPIDRLFALRALGIDALYLQRVKAHGFSHVPVEQLIRLKALDVISLAAPYVAA